MSKQCYYETLNVDRSVGNDELKKAYRKLAMQYHPDRNPGDAEAEHRFKEISEAYDVLRDTDRRAAYDRYGHAAFENGAGGAGGFDFSGNFADVFEDLFGDFMGGRRRQSSSRRGSDLRYDLEISLNEAFRGSEKAIEVPTTVSCEACEGSGAEPGTAPETCPACAGQGKIRTQQGFFMVERTCPSCRGVGRIIANPCKACEGAGRVQKRKKLTVKIPAGVDAGTRIRLSGEGEAGLRGGPPGDLYIFVTVAPHPLFHREGAILFCRAPVPMTTAVLGGEIEVPTAEGKLARLKIPPGTQGGKQFRLKGKGMPQLNSHAVGDMIVEVRVETPTNLSREQKSLLKKFGEADTAKWSPDAEGFAGRAQDILDEDADEA